MGPRSHERGNTADAEATAASNSWLQWGRVLMNAETTTGRLASNANVTSLQWGRVLMNAETRSWPSPGCWLSPLQWGRVLMNAETDPACRSGLARRHASMGPRSHERGNVGIGEGGSGTFVLQWGRVLMNAETS